jgi:cell division transport system permease protein
VRLALREVVIGFRRAPLLSVLSITTIAFSLFAFGLFSLVALNIRNTLRTVESRVEIRAFLTEGASLDSIAKTMETIGAMKEVQRVEYVSPDSALERARREMGEFKDVFEAGFLPASMDIRLRDGFRDPKDVKNVADAVRDMGLVEDVRYGEDWIAKLYKIRNIAAAAGIVLGSAFAAVAIIIIGATIRMTVLARTKEISIMRMVGATDGFVRRPFLIEGFAKGILGGLLALLLTWFANALISKSFIQTDFFPVSLVFLGITAGAIIGGFGSALSVGRHLKRIN